MLQCAIAVDNLATYYFNNITMGEAPTSPAAICFAQHIADCPSLFPEVNSSSLFVRFIATHTKKKRDLIPFYFNGFALTSRY